MWIKYVEVSYFDKETISDFDNFYTDVYMEAFPDEDEREGFDSFLGYLSRAVDVKEYKYHIVLAKDTSNQVIGGCIFNYYKKTNTGVIEFLAVKRDFQSNGIGTMLYNRVVSMLSEDAYQMNGRQLDYICCEIDSPEHSKAEIKKYLYFWNKNNYWRLDFNYVQPSLSATQKSVTGLWLTISPQHTSCRDVPSQLVVDIVWDYLKYAMCIDNPEKCSDYIQMREQIMQSNVVNLSKII